MHVGACVVDRALVRHTWASGVIALGEEEPLSELGCTRHFPLKKEFLLFPLEKKRVFLQRNLFEKSLFSHKPPSSRQRITFPPKNSG